MTTRPPARRLSVRRSDTAGNLFGIFILAVVIFLVLLMWYFSGHPGVGPFSRQPPGILHQG